MKERGVLNSVGGETWRVHTPNGDQTGRQEAIIKRLNGFLETKEKKKQEFLYVRRENRDFSQTKPPANRPLVQSGCTKTTQTELVHQDPGIILWGNLVKI